MPPSRPASHSPGRAERLAPTRPHDVAEGAISPDMLEAARTLHEQLETRALA
jgi:hypothetical protein